MDESVASTPSDALKSVADAGKRPKKGAPASVAYQTERNRRATIARDVYLFLVAFRVLNAFCVRTFFQPDEYFQSLEPAWQIAFGEESGAWITWEWRHRLRSSIHPYIFAAVYWAIDWASGVLRLRPPARAELLLAGPKVLQACFAANGDYYTWKLAERVYVGNSYEAWAALALSVCSAWQWFCSTRTLSNCLETTLTIMALEAWPWEYSLHGSLGKGANPSGSDGKAHPSRQEPYPLENIWRSLGLAAIACILRPTNIVIWVILGTFTIFRMTPFQRSGAARSNTSESLSVSWPTLNPQRQEWLLLVREAFLCGGIMLGLAALFDRSFYQQWTFPPLRFLYFNIAQSLAVFYGKNDWHYYLSQGFPLLLTSYLPFAAIGLYSAYQSYRSDDIRSSGPGIRGQLAIVTIAMPLILSFISHKEVRFIYPLLPILHVLAARPAAACFEPALAPRPPPRLMTLWHYRPIIIPVLLMINVLIGIFTTQIHQLGPLTVMDFLRQEHERNYLIQPPQGTHMIKADTTMTVGFLMPCHSTPWRSHLIYPSIKAWALGCEPPINMDPAEREAYVDEADEFYENPERFLKTHLGKPPSRKTMLGRKNPQDGVGTDEKGFAWDGKPGRKVWPEYLVFFEALEPTMQSVTKNSGYIECWRGWSSWVHDDRRRKGDVIVMCGHAVHPHPRPIGT